MLICMRTTLNLDDELMRLVRRHAADTDRTITQVIEAALHDALAANAHGRPPLRSNGRRCAVGFGPGWTSATATRSSTGCENVRDRGGHEYRDLRSPGGSAGTRMAVLYWRLMGAHGLSAAFTIDAGYEAFAVLSKPNVDMRGRPQLAAGCP